MKCCILFLKKVVLIHFIHFSLTDLLNVPYPYHNRFTKKQKIMSTIIANYLLSIGTVQTVQKQICNITHIKTEQTLFVPNWPVLYYKTIQILSVIQHCCECGRQQFDMATESTRSLQHAALGMPLVGMHLSVQMDERPKQ